MDWLEPKLSFPKELQIITTSDYNTVNYQAMNCCTAHEGTHETAPRMSTWDSTTKEKHDGVPRKNTTRKQNEGAPQRRAKTRQFQDMDQPGWTIRVRQSSKPAGERRTEMKMGASQLIIAQCMARRQPRQHINYCQWVGRFIMFHIIAIANEIMVGRFHMITTSTITWDISNIIMLEINHKNKYYIAIN